MSFLFKENIWLSVANGKIQISLINKNSDCVFHVLLKWHQTIKDAITNVWSFGRYVAQYINNTWMFRVRYKSLVKILSKYMKGQ